MKVNKGRLGNCIGLALLCGLTLTACGGGGSTETGLTEATVTSVSTGYLSQSASSAAMSFPIALSKTVVNGLQVTITGITSTSKVGVTPASLGSAVGGITCAAGVDYAAPSVPFTLTIPAGSTSPYNLPVITVCPNAILSPDKTFKLSWTSGSASGTVIGDIVNNQPGGLASTASSTGILGTPTFGRDTIPLTNSNADGHLGLSYTQLPSGQDWQCTQDNVTGLAWETKSSQSAVIATYTYAQLAAYVAAVNSSQRCGYSDWRLPTVNELESLVDFSISDSSLPAADATYFPDQQRNGYWTADGLAGSSANAWVVDFGNQGLASYQNTSSAYPVLLVRGTSAWSSEAANCTSANSQYVDNGDGTVTDTGTQLMWMQCNNGQSGTGCAGTKTAYTSASQMLADLNAVNQSPTAGLGYSDWRIPTVKELNSLANRVCTDNSAGAINAVVFPNSGQLSNVTATVYAPNSALIWAVDFSNGTISPADPATGGGRPMRLVRAGQ